MSSQSGHVETITSSADLSATTNLGRGINAAGALCNAGANFLGAIVEGGLASGSPVAYITSGPARLRAGAAVTAGDRLTTDANGQFVPVSAANQEYCATAVEAAGAAGDRFDGIVTHGQTSDGVP
jgi:hypothetical protein